MTLTIDGPVRVQRGTTRYVLVTVHGSLDEESAPQLREALKRAFATVPRRLTIDLTGAAVHGRHGLSPLVNALFQCKSNGGVLYLVAPSAMVRRVLSQIDGGVGSLSVHATTAELAKSLTASAGMVGAR